MKTNRSRKVGCVILFGLIGLILLAIGFSALVNQNLPAHSEVVDHLGSLEKVRLAEFIHLRQTLGNAVWPGWGEVDIPVIVYNEQYVFLVGYSDPPSGWVKMPQRQVRGGPWEAVPGDQFYRQTYYRQRLMDPNKTPEGFTVLVGDRWVATFQTMEYFEISFYKGLREEFPPVIREVFPYRLFWNMLSGESDAYITILAHESFHSYQAIVNPLSFTEAEEVMQIENNYPWDETAQVDAWQKELDILVDAAKADSNQEAVELARQFLAQREARRTQSGLSHELVDFERWREWLEGLAKYAELSIGQMAGITPGYESLPEMKDDPQFYDYSKCDRFWSQQLDQVRRILSSEGEVRFYYSGFAQAALLDRLMPGWKEPAMSKGMWLEELLQEAISK